MGQVCAKHNEYYEDRCRWCEAPETDAFLDGVRRVYAAVASRPACDHSKSGICAGCGADILPVSHLVPTFRKVYIDVAEYLGAEKIGPQESKFWMDFISQEFCKRDALTAPNDGHGIFE